MHIFKILTSSFINPVSFSRNSKELKSHTPGEQEKINPMLSQQLVGVAKWAATKKAYTFKPSYFSEYDLDKTKNYTLSNNVELKADTSLNIKSTDFKFILTPIQKPKSSHVARSILETIVRKQVDENNEKPLSVNGSRYITQQNFAQKNGEFIGDMKCDYAISNIGIGKFLDDIFNLELSEDEFNKLKQELLRDFNNEANKSMRQALNLLDGEEEISFEDYKNVTFDDVKKAYEEFKNNSKCQMAIKIPDAEFKKSQNDILNTLESKVPKMRPYQVGTTMNIIAQNAEFKSKSTEENKIVKYFTITDSNTLKDDVLYSLILEAINQSKEKNNVEWFYCMGSDNPQNKSLEIEILDKKLSAQQLQDMLNSAISKISNETMSQEDFENIKNRLKENIIWDISSDYAKSDILLKKYSDISPNYSDYVNTINSITPQEFQERAKKYFSSPNITVINE